VLKFYVLFIFLFTFRTYGQISPVEKFTLKNGLKVVLHEDSKLPLYSINIWYKVGSSNEDPNRTGLAHFFEHLMFKGTKKNADGVFDSYIENNGGSNNAFTTRDVTAYFEDMPKSTLKKILELEADRMKNLIISPKNVKQEREVVKEERRLRVDNSPIGLAFEALYKSSFSKETPYRWPVIGSMKHLEDASIQDFKNFYETYYSPSNAVLVIAGDFKTKEVKSWIKKFFGPLKSSSVPKNNFKPAYKQGQYVQIKKEMNSKVFLYGFEGTKIGNSDDLVLDLVSTILSSGENSYLYQEMVEKNKSFLSVGASNYANLRGGINLLSASLKPGANASKSHKALMKAVKDKSNKGFSTEELKRGVKLMKLGFSSQFKKISSKASHLARSELYYGDYAYHFNDVEKLSKISLEELNQVFKKYYDIKKFNFIEVGK